MTTWTMRSGLVVLALASAAYAEGEKSATKAAPAKTTKMAGKGAIMVNAADIKWMDAPPDIPKGAQLGVLYGDPSKAAPYAVRLKLPDGYKIPPHWHTKDEQLTIISGHFILHMGDTMTSEAHDLDAGAFHFLPGKMHHAAETKGETIVQINATGPFDIRYINASDNPNPKTAKK